MTYGREVVVGVIIIVAVLVAAVGTLWLKGTRFGQTVERVDVVVQDVGQLAQGNDVTILGVRVGQVTTIDLEPAGDLVRLELTLDGEYRLPADAVAVIAPKSLFGDWQVEIVSRAQYPAYAYSEVPVGLDANRIRVLGGYALPDISRLTATAEAVSENLASLTDRFDRAFTEETAENLRLAIGNIQQVSEDIKNLIQQQAVTLDQLSIDVTETAAELNRAAGVARSTFESADRLLASGDVDTLFANLAEASRSFDEIAADVSGAVAGLGATLNRADSAFARVDRVSARIEAGEGALGRLLTDTVLAVRAEGVLAELEILLKDFRENPAKYVRLSIF